MRISASSPRVFSIEVESADTAEDELVAELRRAIDRHDPLPAWLAAAARALPPLRCEAPPHPGDGRSMR